MKRKIAVSELFALLVNQRPKILGRIKRTISDAARIDEGGKESLSFCSHHAKEPLDLIRKSRSGVIICPDFLEFNKGDYRNRTLILVKNPRLAFIRILQSYFSVKTDYSIHPTAIIDPRAKIHRRVGIGPYTYVGECEIGQGTIIHGNVSVYSGTKIGRRVMIHSGTVIGADGFGYERGAKRKLEKFPHLGGVVIEDDVEIGSNTSIDRGVLGSTIIGRGSKIDNLAHIAHNVIVGKHCTIIANAMIGGSVKIGDYAWIAPSACIRDGIKIGKRATVGLGAVVTKDVADGETVMGCPARPAKIYKKMLKMMDRMIEFQDE